MLHSVKPLRMVLLRSFSPSDCLGSVTYDAGDREWVRALDFHNLCGVRAHVRDGMNRDVGGNGTGLPGSSCCVSLHVENRNDP